MRPRNLLIQSCQHRSMRLCKPDQVTIGGLLRSLRPRGKMRDIVIIRNKKEGKRLCALQLQQHTARLCHSKSVNRRLRKHPHKTKLRDGASGQSRKSLRFDPPRYPVMKFVVGKSQRDQRIHIQKKCHGRITLWKVREDIVNVFAAQCRSSISGAPHRQPGNRIGDNPALPCLLPVRHQNNAPGFHADLYRIASLNAKLAPKRPRKNNLSFSRNPGLHGKTILPQSGTWSATAQ
jgi:hypothetical protein